HYARSLLAIDDPELSRKAHAEAVALDPGQPLVVLVSLLEGLFGTDHGRVEAAMPAVLEHRDPWIRAVGLGVRSRWLMERGDLAAAERDGLAAVIALRAIGDRWALAIMLSSLAEP